ncbi:IucA/IucC family protein [Roseibium sp.]|uniref:IucA/IucC family protein n=1 Tax=Roseibium sp. TaxID=1936156 RepID=UPI003A976DAA
MNELIQTGFSQSVRTASERADHATATAFLNALLREWDQWTVLDPTDASDLGLSGRHACLPLHSGTSRLLIRLTHHGRFRQAFSLPFLLWQESRIPAEIPLAEAITRLVLDESASGGDPQRQLKLLQRILDSRLATEVAFDRKDRASSADSWNFQDAEQALLSGHATHPNPRSRDEVTDTEAERYAPERGGHFPLFWILAHQSILTLKASGEKPAEDHCRDLLQSDDQLPKCLKENLPDGFIAIPWHPWQAVRLLADPLVIRHINGGKLRIVGEAGKTFAATGSMRGIHAWHAPYMLKFSLSMRLTNSERVLAHKEVERGIQMCRLLQSPVGEDIKRREPRLNILREPAYVALKDDDGSPVEKSFVVFRDNPFNDPRQSGPVMLASLCEEQLDAPSPLGNLITTRAQRLSIQAGAAANEWLRQFVTVAIAPLLRVRATHGLLFGSHQQNMMISLEDGLPSEVWVRDCQGTGHLTTHHKQLEQHVPDIGRYSENVATPELGDNLLCYYVIVNNLMNVVATLAVDRLLDEDTAYAVIRQVLLDEKAACDGDTAFYDLLLSSPTLCSKGNYRTSLSGVNEAAGDAGGQLASFLQIPNPLSHPEIAP